MARAPLSLPAPTARVGGHSGRDSPASQVLDSDRKMTWGSPASAGASTQVCQLVDLHLDISGPKSRRTERQGAAFLSFPSFTLLSLLGGGPQGAPSPKPLRCSEKRGLPGRRGGGGGEAEPLLASPHPWCSAESDMPGTRAGPWGVPALENLSYSILRGELTQGVEERVVWRLDLVPVLPLIGWRPWASHLTSLAWKREGIGLDLRFSDHLGTFCRGSWGKVESWSGPLPSCVSQSEQTDLHSPKSLQDRHILSTGSTCWNLAKIVTGSHFFAAGFWRVSDQGLPIRSREDLNTGLMGP